MTDIVKRLRAAAFNDAADEIERLRKGWKKEADKDCKWALKEIERLETEVSDWKDHSLKQSDEIERLRADLKSEREAHEVCVQMRNDAETDNKRLRAALKPFAQKADTFSLSHALGHITREHLLDARRALELGEVARRLGVRR